MKRLSGYTPRKFSKWVRYALKRHIDEDGVFEAQCVDVPKNLVDKLLYPKIGWAKVGLYGNGKDIYKNAKTAYFKKYTHKKGHRVQRGDILSYGATKTNKYGHTCVVISHKIFNRKSFTVIEQNGFNPSGVAYKAKRNYNNLVGVVRAK